MSEENGVYSWKLVSMPDLCEALPNYNSKDIYYSLFNLEQAGYIDAMPLRADGGVYSYFVNYITFSGHEYLANIRSNRNWEKTKEIGSKVGVFGLNIIAKIAEGVATAYLKQQLELL